jgi:hypothetical protein
VVGAERSNDAIGEKKGTAFAHNKRIANDFKYLLICKNLIQQIRASGDY